MKMSVKAGVRDRDGQQEPISPSRDQQFLRINGLAMSYGDMEVLHSVSLDVVEGEFLTILGPSGSGKTTLLRLIAGMETPRKGEIVFGGKDLASTPINRRPFNTVFQDYALFPHMTVAKNVGYGLMVKGVARSERERKVEEALELVGLADKPNRFPNQLSGGQKQRVALARALVNEPSIVLLDEPLSALDAVLRQQMQSFLKSVQETTGVTFIFVTHDQDEAIALSDRICVMNGGSIEQLDTPEKIYRSPNTDFVSRFFGANNFLPITGIQNGVVETSIGSIETSLDMPLLSMPANACIRPEDVLLGRGPDGLECQGRVIDVVYGGASSSVVVQIDDDPSQKVTVKLWGARCPQVSRGQLVTLTLPHEAISFVPCSEAST